MTDNNPPQLPQIPDGGTTQKYPNGTLITRSFYDGEDGYDEYDEYDEDNAKKGW